MTSLELGRPSLAGYNVGFSMDGMMADPSRYRVEGAIGDEERYVRVREIFVGCFGCKGFAELPYVLFRQKGHGRVCDCSRFSGPSNL